MENLPLRVGQYALIVNPEGKILVLERSRSKTWSLPGGRLEEGERDWLAALKREVKEETSLEFKEAIPIKVNIVVDEPYQIKYCVYFKINLDIAREVGLTDEHSAYRWILPMESSEFNFEYPFLSELVESYK